MKIITAILTSVIMSGCMSTVSMQLMRPADITIPQHIQTIALVNRTKSSKQGLNIVEGILTGEGIGQDKEGAALVLEGARNRMQESSRYQVVKTNIELKGGMYGEAAESLSWEEIEKICADHQADAVLILEEFDTDWVVTNGSGPVKRKNAEGKEVTVIQFWAQGIATARIGFKLYDPKTKSIADQQRFAHNNTWTAHGNSLQDAMVQLINRREATRQVSVATGRVYAERITPSWYRAQREFYKKSKGNDDMARGRRKADVGDWNGAAENWQKAVQSGDEKTKGRAAFNMALANEVNGNLEEAKSWADKSYTEYGNKKGRAYANLLERRIWEAEKVRQQMEGE